MNINKDGNLEFNSEFRKINTARNVFVESNQIISIFLDCAHKTNDGYIITPECIKKVNKTLSLYLQKLFLEL